jgi:lipoprotein-anchoring transpeptidase ErfK/SrfK
VSVGVRRLWFVAAVAATGVLVLGACSSGHNTASKGTSPVGNNTPTGDTSSSSTPTSKPPAPPAKLSAKPANGAANVSPTGQISVAVADGTLSSVTMTNADGKAIKGAYNTAKSSWQVAEPLGYSKAYTVVAKAVNADGKPISKTSHFTTVTPDNMTMPDIETTGRQALKNGATYGVGMVVSVHFDEPITDKAAAERTLKVTTAPAVVGSWYWMDQQNVHWRPQHYYKTGTKVSVSANVYGKQVSPGLYGQGDVSASFKIGAKHVSIADDTTHTVKVYYNDKLVRRMPTSMGQGGYVQGSHGQISLWTMPGTYTVIGHANPVLMDSSTYGLPVNSPKGYKEYIYLATQISTDGIYLHQLDSTVWAQGHQDLSHGCLNLNQSNAKWFYDTSLVGDIVQVRNTGGPKLQVWQNGDWSVPWSTWVAGSALH